MKTESVKTTVDGIDQLHLSGKFTAAIEYARHIHIERRKGTEIPYMAHLLGVSSLVMGEAGHASFRPASPHASDQVVSTLHILGVLIFFQ